MDKVWEIFNHDPQPAASCPESAKSKGDKPSETDKTQPEDSKSHDGATKNGEEEGKADTGSKKAGEQLPLKDSREKRRVKDYAEDKPAEGEGRESKKRKKKRADKEDPQSEKFSKSERDALDSAMAEGKDLNVVSKRRRERRQKLRRMCES